MDPVGGSRVVKAGIDPKSGQVDFKSAAVAAGIELVAGQEFGAIVKDFKNNPGNWGLVSAQVEKATSKGARQGGVSVQEIFENKETGVRVIRHTVTNNKNKVVDSHLRPTYKPRKGEINAQ